jgi:predicted enzyme related to lactoylglutathione lyase
MTVLKINYVEFSTREIGKTTAFFARAFGWTYADYGPEYQSFTNAGVDGGFFDNPEPIPPLVVLKADDLEAALKSVTDAGGIVVKPIFDFPGGRRFHFREPGGNELAVWSET